MFNSKYKKEALANFNKSIELYTEKWNEMIKHVEKLHDSRIDSLNVIKNVEDYLELISNKPEDIIKEIEIISINRQSFQDEIDEIEKLSDESSNFSGGVAAAGVAGAGVAGAGVATGIGVAAFGPTAAMAIATTFGTASTGAAISGLTGAAATNAALAWLGGGALAAGGGGMAAGSALLGLAGPIGLVIGGTALLGGGLLANSKNKKVAGEAEEKTKEVKEVITGLSMLNTKVNSMKGLTEKSKLGLIFELEKNKRFDCLDFNEMCDNQLTSLQEIINIAKSLSEMIKEKIDG